MKREVIILEDVLNDPRVDYDSLKKLALRTVLDRNPAVRQEAIENLNIVFDDRLRQGYVEGTSLYVELRSDSGDLIKFYVCETYDYPDPTYVPFNMDSN